MFCCINVVLGEQQSPPRIITRVQVTLNGDVYYVDDVTTVEMLQKRLWEESGYTKLQQGVVFYQGQILSQPNLALSDVGVQDSGDQINMIPSNLAQHWKLMNEMKIGLHKLHLQMNQQTSNNNGNSSDKKEQLKVLIELYNDITNKIPYMQEEMDEFMIRMRYPISLQYASDPDRIEKLRQIIVNNPMLLSHIMMMNNNNGNRNQRTFGSSTTSTNPASSSSTSSSLGYIIQDKRKWRQLVQRSVGRWKTMSAYQMWQLLVREDNLQQFDNSISTEDNNGNSNRENNAEEGYYEDEDGLDHTHAEEEEDDEEEEEEEEEE